MDIEELIKKARHSPWSLWKLNFLLHRYIPFNKPHNLNITSIDTQKVVVKLPYRKSNLNHLKGLHACAMATAAEYASGLLLLYKSGLGKYRIIMESLQVSYHYQGHKDAFATFEMNDQTFQDSVLSPLKKDGVVYVKCKIPLKDIEGNVLCEVSTNWQIKKWDKVKTKQ